MNAHFVTAEAPWCYQHQCNLAKNFQTRHEKDVANGRAFEYDVLGRPTHIVVLVATGWEYGLVHHGLRPVTLKACIGGHT
jgi:hypothetical protein